MILCQNNENFEKEHMLIKIFDNLSSKTREQLWKEFFEKAKPDMNILEFLEEKIKKGEIKPKTLNTIMT